MQMIRCFLPIGALLPLLAVSCGHRAAAGLRAEATVQDNRAWPDLQTGVSLLPEVSWRSLERGEAPRAGVYLPDYGSQSPAEVNRTINLVWNECKSMEHVPGTKARDLVKELEAHVAIVVTTLSYKPTKAQLDVLKATACDTFLIMNLSYGGPRTVYPDADIILDANHLSDDRTYHLGDMIDATMKLPKMMGVCGAITTYTAELYKLMGLRARSFAGTCREAYGPTDTGNPINPDNHAWSGLLVPNRLFANVPQATLDIVGHRKYIYGEMSYAVLASDNTWGIVPEKQRDRYRRCTVFPRPSMSMVGAKGDDDLRTMFWMTRVNHFFESPFFVGSPKLLPAAASFPQGETAARALNEFERSLIPR